MNIKVLNISRAAVFASLIVIGEALETVLPSLKSGGTLKLPEVVTAALVVMTLMKSKDKLYTMQLSSISVVLAVIVCYSLGLYKYAIGAPLVLMFDYIIPMLSVTLLGLVKIDKNNVNKTKIFLVLSTIIVGLISFASHVFSGIVMWGTPLVASLTYNLGYSLLTLMTQIAIVLAIASRQIKN